MPCAEGELCAQPDTTPQDPHGHGCQGGCGGRLHGICGGVVDDDNENHRICSACVAKASAKRQQQIFKDRLSAIMCANADGTAKVDMAIIGKAKEPINSNNIDPFRSLLTPQAWARHHKPNTTSLVPVPALMRDRPALNSAVLALFATVPGARFSAGERSVHVPALNRAQYCTADRYHTKYRAGSGDM